ncbi:ligand-binding sensor domain-containing protein [Marimonas arenosa]|uniref:Two component regulator with propeller domain n=1 Tax=Marimonas arenosa TaxID=1795305 RepID=A0AAE3WEB2_9RHOB|nr:two-component regulator propeller domain-containing protein [Marimonas arenosa]MDQ2090073.1 hypothetical protein [Marimonas arenosa]
MENLQPIKNRYRTAVSLAGFWLLAAGVAVWSLFPTHIDYVAPQGWRHVAPQMQVQDILAGSKTVWLAGIEGLAKVGAQGHVTTVKVDGVEDEPMVRAIAVDASGMIWIAHRAGLSRVDGENESSSDVARGPGGQMRALALDTLGRLWAGGDSGLFRISPDGTATHVELPVGGVEITALLADTQGGLWVGSVKHGLLRLEGEDWSAWGVAEGLPHPQVTSLMQDRDSRIWVGTGFYSKGGAARLDSMSDGWKITAVLTDADLAGPKVRSLFQDAYGGMWFGHEYDGLTLRRDGKTLATLGVQDGLPDAEVTVIRSDGSGGMWIGTLKGAVHLSAATLTQLYEKYPGENDDA